MSDPTPIDCYTAQEVFSLFYDWYWRYEPERTVLTSDGAPLSPEDQAAGRTDAPPNPELRQILIRGEMQDQAAYVLLQLLIRGEIELLARDRAGVLGRITPDELSAGGFPERPFYGAPILAPSGDALHEFNGRNMYVRKEQVDHWFATRSVAPNSSGTERDELSGEQFAGGEIVEHPLAEKKRQRSLDPEDRASRAMKDNAMLRELLSRWPNEMTRPSDRKMASELATGTRKYETNRKRIRNWRRAGKLGSATQRD